MKRIAKIAFAALLTASCTAAPQLTKSGLNPADFDSEYDGQKTQLFTLTNASGMEVCITNFGGRIVSVMVPDRNGEYKDVVLGFSTVAEYFPENNDSNFGACIGRYANRIGAGKFSIDGQEYNLPLNDGENTLHGGPTGFHYRVFDVLEADAQHVKLALTSDDGDNNFPGTVNATVTYTLTDANAIELAYEATTDKATVINLTNHSYFNLSGDPANHCVEDDVMYVNSSKFTPTDSGLIPTGEIAELEGTPLDFRTETRIGDRIGQTDFEPIDLGHGYDHNWILDTDCDLTKVAATVTCPETGICLTVYTDEPGLQIYSGNFLDGTMTGKNGAVYARRHAICLESQHFPDTPNKPEWPSAVLRPGETYHSNCIYAFSTSAE